MDTEVFLQKPLQRKEFHGTETTEFLFNRYEILNILNYKSSHSIYSLVIQGQIILVHFTRVYTQLGNENRKENDSLDTPFFCHLCSFRCFYKHSSSPKSQAPGHTGPKGRNTNASLPGYKITVGQEIVLTTSSYMSFITQNHH